MRTMTLLALLSLIAGCKSTPPDRVLTVSNAGYQLDQLFTDDRGDTVYRFYDKGDWRYYVIGPDGHAQMVPSTRAARGGADATIIEPGFGVGVGGRIDGRRR